MNMLEIAYGQHREQLLPVSVVVYVPLLPHHNSCFIAPIVEFNVAVVDRPTLSTTESNLGGTAFELIRFWLRFWPFAFSHDESSQ